MHAADNSSHVTNVHNGLFFVLILDAIVSGRMYHYKAVACGIINQVNSKPGYIFGSSFLVDVRRVPPGVMTLTCPL